MSDDQHLPPTITIYTTPTCFWCNAARRYMRENGIEYTEVDLTTDVTGRREAVLMTGTRAVPVIRVGSQAMVGWDEQEFETLRSGRSGRR